MASPTLNDVSTSTVGFPADAFTASLIYGTKWGGSLGTGVILTYSFPEGANTAYDAGSYPSPNEWNFGNGWTPLDALQQMNFEDALVSWANVADIQFTEVGDDGSVVGEIRVAFSELVYAQGAGAWAYLPDNFPYAGDIWLSHLDIFESLDEGSWQFNTIIHELGHALGLKHPFDTDGSNVVLATEFDNLFYTVMTYTDDPSGNEYYIDRYPDTPMVIDILAIQYLYGENTTHNDEDSVYVYLDAGLYFETIWDAGGDDTLEHQGNDDVIIDLRPGHYSTLGQPIVFTDGVGGPVAYTDPRTVWIAYGADIENAVGGEGNDQLVGNAMDNDLYGGDGMDMAAFWGAENGVTVDLAAVGAQDTGSDGLDSLWDIEGLSGSDFGDLLIGDAGDNTLSGEAGDDALIGAMGNDLLDGGDGSDTAAYDDALVAVTVNLSAPGAQDTVGAGFDTLTDIENLSGSGFNDLLTGDSGDNVLSGGAGNDALDGGDGSDTAGFSAALVAVTVNLSVAGAQDTVGAGFDTLTDIENLSGSGFNDMLTGDSGNNRLSGGAGDDSLFGNLGADALAGDEGADTLWGGSEADALDGGAGIDALYGGSGDDVYTVTTGDGVFENADEGKDTVKASFTATLVANVENLILLGSANVNGTGNGLKNSITGAGGKNSLSGLDGDDVLNGMAGNDFLAGGAGNDRLQGGAGADVIEYDADDGSIVDGGSGSDTLRLTGSDLILNLAGLAGTLYVGFETIDLTGAGDNTVSFDATDLAALSSTSDTLSITGNDGDIVTAIGPWTPGGEVAIGSVNYNKFSSGAATVLVQVDVLFSAELDEADVDDPGDPDDGPLNEDGFAGDDELDGSAFDDRLAGLGGDDLINGGAGIDTLLGNSGDDMLNGGAGNDTLKGGGGEDVIQGGAGDDIIKGGGGNDLLDGANGSDTYILAAGDASTDAYQDSGTGIDDVDEIDGSKVNALHLGAVFSHAESGIEIITGADTGTQIVDAEGPVAWDFTEVTLADISALVGTGAGDVITGSAGHDKLRGRGGADELNGGAGRDTLLGQGGADILNGGAGKDVLTGGKGADLFVFNTELGSAKADHITDFSTGVDRLQLDAGIFSALTTPPGAGLDDAEFRSGADNAAQDPDVRIIYNTTTGALYYDADGNGDGEAIRIAVLDGAPALTGDDFLISS